MINIVRKMLRENINIYSIIMFLSFLVVIGIIVFLSKDNPLAVDDFMECSYMKDEGIFDSLFFDVGCSGGGYTSRFLTKLFTLGIPYILNIHPGDYLSKIEPFLKGVLFCIFFYISAKCFLLRNHGKKLFVSIFIFLIFSILFQLQLPGGNLCISDNVTFFQYLFTSFFFYIIYTYTYKNITFRNSKYNGFELLFIIFAALVSATNLETIIFSLCMFFFLIIVYNCVVDFIYGCRQCRCTKNLYKYNLNLNFYIPVASFYIMVVLYIFSSQFYTNFDGRGFGDFSFSFDSIFDFLKLFGMVYVLNNFLYWIIFISLALAYLLKRKNILNKKKLLCSVFMLLSIISVYFSLFLFGKNSYDGGFWIDDVKLIIFFRIMILAPIFILANDFLRHTKAKYKNICINVICGCLLLSSIQHGYLMHKYKHGITDMYIYKRVNYINEKMYRYFSLKNETPYLLKINPMADEPDWFPFPFLEILQDEDRTKPVVCSYNATRTSIYIEKVYKIKMPDGVKFCLSDDALDKFFKSGGFISRSELDNINFSNLKDEKYVLNNNVQETDKMSKKEIIDIFRYFHN